MKESMFRLTDFIICDEIRQEISKKHILIGVYDSLVILKNPEIVKLGYFQQNLAVFMRIKSPRKYESFVIELNVLNQTKELGTYKIPVANNATDKLNLVLNIPSVKIPLDSEYLAFSIVIKGEDSVLESFSPDKIQLSFVEKDKFLIQN